MNEFSLVCRILGSFFYRSPQDPVLAPILALLSNGQIKQNWPLEQDELLERWQSAASDPALLSDYQAMFAENGSVSPYRRDYTDGNEQQCRDFLSQIGMPLSDKGADHFGLLLLAASWIEDHSAEDEIQAQITLFDDYLLPWCGKFLGKVESHAASHFYRVLAMISRETLQAMRDELSEIEDNLADDE
jgi:TorA maturation chaperone TorD